MQAAVFAYVLQLLCFLYSLNNPVSNPSVPNVSPFWDLGIPIFLSNLIVFPYALLAGLFYFYYQAKIHANLSWGIPFGIGVAGPVLASVITNGDFLTSAFVSCCGTVFLSVSIMVYGLIEFLWKLVKNFVRCLAELSED